MCHKWTITYYNHRGDFMAYTHIKGMLRALTKEGIKAEIWQDRILLHGFGRDITAYLTFKNPADETWLDNLFKGCALKVFIHPPLTADSGHYALHRRQEVIDQITAELHRVEITTLAPPDNPRDMVRIPEDDDSRPER